MNGKLLAVMVATILAIASFGVYLWANNDDRVTITIGFSNKTCYETMIVANALGYFDDIDGVRVNVTIQDGGSGTAAALLAGHIDIGAMGDTPAVTTLYASDQFSLLGRYAYSPAMHKFVAHAESGISIEEIENGDFSSLEGKKIGVQQNSSTHGALLNWIDVNNVTGHELVFMNTTMLQAALGDRVVDMIVASDPVPTLIMNSSIPTVFIGDSSDLGNTYPLVLLATNKVIEENPDAVMKIMEAFHRANIFINENWEEAAQMAANVIGLSKADQLECMGSIIWQMGMETKDFEGLTQTASVLRDFGRITGAIDFEERFAGQFMEALKTT
ncbi:MAG: ABC transporter substrate-binding protein [Methanomassiliicoccaceae archaeon]|nr:ABC transporter substrate-binding protein [Methanomassiliicoccaceae archaeon]